MKLRQYQEEAVMQTMMFFTKKKGKNGIIALPTGSGKSLVIAEIIRLVRLRWNAKILILSHVKEILEQNKSEIESHLGIEVGVNSSMLGKREVKDVTVAGIQSVFRNPDQFSEHNLIIIDEAHRVSTEQDSMYKTFLDGIGRHVCVGLTATPFRLGDGYIYGPGKLFDELIYDCTASDRFLKLIESNYLCKLTTKCTNLEMDTTSIKITAGDFNEKQLADEFDRDSVTTAAVQEIISSGADRKSWLIFAIDINHAEHITETLLRSGISAAPVHSRMSDYGLDRDKVISDFKSGKYRAIVNVNVLTTGFNHPGIDLIAILRPTQSPVLHVQILGRGCRTSTGKKNCLVLDFGGNTARLGPINDVLVKVKGKGATGGDPITKTCPECKSILPPAIKICPDCGHEFKFQHGLSATASDAKIIEDNKENWIQVDGVEYEINSKYGAPSSLKVTYNYGKKSVSEYICIEHSGFAKHKADHWVKYRGGEKCDTVQDLMKQTPILKTPSQILVQKRGAYYVIKNSIFNS